MGILCDLGKAVIGNVTSQVNERIEMYDKFSDMASDRSDESLVEAYSRLRKRSDKSTRTIMQMTALRNQLRERGYDVD